MAVTKPRSPPCQSFLKNSRRAGLSKTCPMSLRRDIGRGPTLPAEAATPSSSRSSMPSAANNDGVVLLRLQARRGDREMQRSHMDYVTEFLLGQSEQAQVVGFSLTRKRCSSKRPARDLARSGTARQGLGTHRRESHHGQGEPDCDCIGEVRGRGSLSPFPGTLARRP